MEFIIKNQNRIRPLHKNESIPYFLLLLADESIEVIDKYIKDCEIFVCEKCSAIIAVYALLPINKDIAEIKNIAVSEMYQGRGVGKFLLKDASIRAKGKGYRTLIIGTGDALTRLLYFYQKEGFQIFDVRRNFFIDNYASPIFEKGVRLKDMIMLKKELN